MFSQEIALIKCFTDRFSEEQEVLKRITADTYCTDNTLKAVTRALLFTRLPEEATFCSKLVYNEGNYGCFVNPNSFVIFYYADKAEMEKRSGEFIEVNNDFTLLKRQTDYLASYAECRIYTRAATNTAVIFTYDLSVRKLHMLLSLFPAYFKASFFTEKPLDDDEKQLCLTLSGRSPQDFERAIAVIAKKSGLSDIMLQSMLRTFTKTNMESMIEQAEKDRNEAKERLEENMETYRALLKEYRNKIYFLEGLMTHREGEDTGIDRVFQDAQESAARRYFR